MSGTTKQSPALNLENGITQGDCNDNKILQQAVRERCNSLIKITSPQCHAGLDPASRIQLRNELILDSRFRGNDFEEVLIHGHHLKDDPNITRRISV